MIFLRVTWLCKILDSDLLGPWRWLILNNSNTKVDNKCHIKSVQGRSLARFTSAYWQCGKNVSFFWHHTLVNVMTITGCRCENSIRNIWAPVLLTRQQKQSEWEHLQVTDGDKITLTIWGSDNNNSVKSCDICLIMFNDLHQGRELSKQKKININIFRFYWKYTVWCK